MNAEKLIQLIQRIQKHTHNDNVEINFYDDSQRELVHLSEIYWYGKALPIEQSIGQICGDDKSFANIPIGPKIN